MQITQGTLAGLFSNFNTTFSNAYDAVPTWVDKVASVEPSGSAQNLYAWMQRMPALRQWVGPRQINALATYLQTVQNVLFEDTIAVDRIVIEDDQFGMYAPALKMLGEQAAKWPDQTMAATIQAAHSTVCYDGQFFFDTDHPVNVYDSTVLAPDATNQQSNYFGSTALTPDNFATVMNKMMAWVGEDGKPLAVVPDLLVVPPQLQYIARNILNASFIAPQTVGGNTQVGANDNVLKGAVDLLVVPELASDAKSWFLLSTKRAVKPFIWQLRKAPQLIPLTSPTDPNSFALHQFLYGVEARGAAATSLWWLAAQAKAA